MKNLMPVLFLMALLPLSANARADINCKATLWHPGGQTVQANFKKGALSMGIQWYEASIENFKYYVQESRWGLNGTIALNENLEPQQRALASGDLIPDKQTELVYTTHAAQATIKCNY